MRIDSTLGLICPLLLIVPALLASSASAAPTPVAAYGFENASATVVSDSVGDNDGALQNGAAYTAFSQGRYGRALRFDGVDDFVSIPDAAELDFTDAFTLEAWVKPETSSWTV